MKNDPKDIKKMYDIQFTFGFIFNSLCYCLIIRLSQHYIICQS